MTVWHKKFYLSHQFRNGLLLADRNPYLQADEYRRRGCVSSRAVSRHPVSTAHHRLTATVRRLPNLQNFTAMYITFNELRDIKHKLPTGSVARIAKELGIEEQTVRNFFGARKYDNGQIVDIQIQPGPNGGIVQIEDTRILDAAKRILEEAGIQIATPTN